LSAAVLYSTMFDEERLQSTLVELEKAISNNAEVDNTYIHEVTAAAKSSARGQEFLYQHNCCSILHRLLKTVSEKFKLEEEDAPSKPVFKAGDAVNTVWGSGQVQSLRESDGLYIVLLDNWRLAQGQSPTLYLGADAMTKSAAIFRAGDAVDTVWGVGKVKSYRSKDNLYVVLLDHWKLAQGQSPTLYLGADSMTKSAVSAFSVDDPVSTVWGVGKVKSYREEDNLYVVLLDKWKLAQGQSPTLYLGADSMTKRDLEYERKLAEVKAAHDDALVKIAALLTAIGAIMRRSLPKSHSCTGAIQTFVELGFVELVSDCLNKFMHDPATVNAACWCIMVMCSDDPDNQVALAKAGACEGVMQALSTHAGNADIIEYVCRAARNLTSNLSIAQHCVGSGIGELIACVIILHMNRPAQCEAGLWVVTNLSCDSNNATVLGGIGMCDAITSVLRTHLDNAALCAAAAWTVKNLACGSKFNYSQFIHTDICDSLLAILKNFSDDRDVLSPTLWAIANITCDPALSLKINENDDICDRVVSILSAYIAKTRESLATNAGDLVDNLDIVEAAMWALRNIASVGSTNNTINESVSESIHQVLTIEYFLSDESLVDSALATLVNILSNLSADNTTFRDMLRVQGFAPILQGLMSRHELDSIMRQASKAVSMFATNSEPNRQLMLDIGACRSAVSMMQTYKRNESVVLAACELLFSLYYSHSPSEMSRLLDSGLIAVVTKEDGKTTTEICSKPFNEIVAGWLPDTVTKETGWLAKSS
jgi:hypothetical protein